MTNAHGSCEVRVGEGCRIHPTTLLGYCPVSEASPIVIGDNVEIGAFCVIEAGVVIGGNVKVAHHAIVASGAEIGEGSLIVDAVRVDRRARIGRNCVIGGNVSDRAILGDDVTFMGGMAHVYADATEPWEGTDEISPIIRTGTVIAQAAQIIGGITIGEGCYVAAGELVRSDVPPRSFVGGGTVRPLAAMRGLVRSRLTDQP